MNHLFEIIFIFRTCCTEMFSLINFSDGEKAFDKLWFDAFLNLTIYKVEY